MKEINLLSKTIEISNVGLGIVTILIIVFVIRVIFNIFKMCAIRQGEADNKDDGVKFSHWGKWEAFWRSFCNRGKSKNVDDYFLPSIIGFFELCMYPFLMLLEQWVFIAMLIGLKTAVQWRKWQEIRTAYNRFLLGNLLVIFCSLFIMASFLKINAEDLNRQNTNYEYLGKNKKGEFYRFSKQSGEVEVKISSQWQSIAYSLEDIKK